MVERPKPVLLISSSSLINRSFASIVPPFGNAFPLCCGAFQCIQFRKIIHHYEIVKFKTTTKTKKCSLFFNHWNHTHVKKARSRKRYVKRTPLHAKFIAFFYSISANLQLKKSYKANICKAHSHFLRFFNWKNYIKLRKISVKKNQSSPLPILQALRCNVYSGFTW